MKRGKQFEEGNPGKPKGAKNKKTKQWEVFSTYCLNGGLIKFQEELNKLDGKDYVNAFTNLLEFHKPKLQRGEVVGDLNIHTTISDMTQFKIKPRG